MRSWIGQFMIERLDCFAIKVALGAIGNEAAITPAVMDHYRNALPTPQAREAGAALPGHIVRASDWPEEVWRDREDFAQKPALALRGLKDVAFRRTELERWRARLGNCPVREYGDCGHFLAEEAPERILPKLRRCVAPG